MKETRAWSWQRWRKNHSPAGLSDLKSLDDDQLVPQAALLTGVLAGSLLGNLGRQSPSHLLWLRLRRICPYFSSWSCLQLHLLWLDLVAALCRVGLVNSWASGLLESELEPDLSGKSQLVHTVPQSGEASKLQAASLKAKATEPKVMLEVEELLKRRKHQLEQRSSLHPRPYPGYSLGH